MVLLLQNVIFRTKPINKPIQQFSKLIRTAPASSVVLRDYQEECINACTTALRKGTTRIGVSMPTGSGKTTVFVSLLHRLPVTDIRPNATRSLIIVNSIELALQAANQFKRMYPKTSVEVEQGKNIATGLADV